MAYLRAENLSKSFGRVRALSAVSLHVETGGVLGVTGPNGAGKTTLLRILAGLLRPSAGVVECGDGNDLWDASARRTRTGYTSPELSLYEPLTARENLDFFAQMRGRPADSQALLELVGLADRADEPIHTFSSGMKQRLKLAYAIQAEPVILLLDEPGVTLDAGGRELVQTILARQRRRGLALLATNDPAEVRWADETLVLGA